MARRAKTAADLDAWLTDAADERAKQIALIDADRDDSIQGECFDKAGIARICRVPVYRVTEAIRRGAPVESRGSQHTPWRINLGDFMRWQIKDALGLLDDAEATQATIYRAEKCRKMKADADRIEFDNARKRSETLTVDEAVTLYAEAMAPVRAAAAAFPGRVVQALSAMPADKRASASHVEAVVEDEIQVLLRRAGADHGSAH